LKVDRKDLKRDMIKIKLMAFKGKQRKELSFILDLLVVGSIDGEKVGTYNRNIQKYELSM